VKAVQVPVDHFDHGKKQTVQGWLQPAGKSGGARLFDVIQTYN
jgi:hypothetical protein